MWGNLEKILEEKNMTLYRLSKEAGVHVNTLQNIKTGKSKNPSFKLIVKIADALDVSLDEFRKEEK